MDVFPRAREQLLVDQFDVQHEHAQHEHAQHEHAQHDIGIWISRR
jgi:hypothetical protein